MESIADEYRIKFTANDDDNFIETLPFFESYHLTRLDIWILATYYKLPIIILYYPNKALIETKDEYSILTTYFEENISEQIMREPESGMGMGMAMGMAKGKKPADSDEELPLMGESAYDVARNKPSNVQGYYFIIAPAIKPNVVPAYSIIFRKKSGRFESERSETSETSETSELREPETANEYYISMNVLTQGFQSVVIQQQSTQYIDPEGPAHSEDDESSQMKESVRYKKSVMQFIHNFKQPSKKGRGDDSSSVGTGISLDTQDEDIADMTLTSVVGKRMKKPTKQMRKINVSGPLSAEASGIESSAAAVAEKKQKGRPRIKGKGIGINVSSLNISPPEQEQESAALPTSALVEPAKKPSKLKKLNINPSNLPLFGVNDPPQEQLQPSQPSQPSLPKLKRLPQIPQIQQLIDEERGLSDIVEASDEEDV